MSITMQIFGPDGTRYEGTDTLPAPAPELDDILFNAAQSFNCETARLTLWYWCDEVGFHGTIHPGESLAELNFLALRLENLPPDMQELYSSGLTVLKEPTLEMRINLSYSLDQRHQFRASSDSDIGREVLWRELVTVPNKLLGCIDQAALGRKYREEHGGILYAGWYMSGPGTELKEVYHSADLRQGVKLPFPDALQDVQCAIKILLVPNREPEPSTDDGIWLKLPATDAAKSFALEQLGVSCLEDCCIYCIDSTATEIRGCSAQITELDQLAELAERLEALDENGQDTYNAVLEWELENTSPRVADFLNYLHNLEYYELDTGIRDEYELGKHFLKCDGYRLSEDLHDYFNFEQYVRDSQTNYSGALVSAGYISRSANKKQMEFPYRIPEETDPEMMLCQS